ncbi:5-dehydro-2-deoxygluconokinase [Palleronia sediminis]|uniref:5-dehydro-2-deoxygluconokinase n=1 Tax=Palleronia sediminis TaxID=2547833 RepID=A0A4R5ZXR1_9RHOB|nr:5-dehydro-2-deoxygluconokinase [Palleronia sediminis]TDL75961.1 5-dehydro-2-deoxygluconokinase [Palleronia sediminis]
MSEGASPEAGPLDIVTIGRASVDLYGAQVGGRLEDMRGFAKYIGGSPTNIACGAARLGLRAALISAVGDEHMGRFIREELIREGVEVSGLKTDPDRLTALVLLGIRDDDSFPLIFYRENCADMGLTPKDIDPALIARARALVVTGTHLSHPRVEAAVLHAIGIARDAGLRIALDIDYRPNLWGLAGHGAGDSRFVESAAVTARLAAHLHRFDLIVGTEEEFHIAGGSTDTRAALAAVRAVSDAVLVCKRGPMGAVAFDGPIPASLEAGLAGPGRDVEVFNVLGAGDGFMAGLLKGWLDGAGWTTALSYANACGALAVSRHGCTPAYPSWTELQLFLGRGVVRRDLRHDAELEQVHWATTRKGRWDDLRVFAFDHRAQMEEMEGADPERIGRFKLLCLEAATRQAARDGGSHGILCDERLGRSALRAAAGRGLWTGRPVELPGSRPLALETQLGPDCGGLGEWPRDHVVKCLCFAHPDDDAALWADQIATVGRLFHAARRNGLEMLLEVIPSKVGAVGDDTTARVIERFYDAGIHPDWWKLEPFATEAAWAAACDAIERHDPHTRGIVVLGLDAPEAALAESFALAARFPLVKGFAVGRTIFGQVARDWFAGRIDDGAAIDTMAANYARLCDIWTQARKGRE